LSRLLLIDDDEDIRLAFGQILESDGHEVRDAADAEAALEILASEQFDLVITDLLLPGMDGAELCRMMRADSRLADLPIVLLTCVRTTMGIEITAEDSHWAPFTRIVDKQYAVTVIIDTVRELLKQRE